MKKKSALIVILSIILSFGIQAVSLEELNNSFLTMGFSIPRSELPSVNFELKNLEGVTETLEDYRGKVVFLNFWASWCAPCRMEMPSMQQLYDTYRVDGLEIVAVNKGERESTARNFIESNEYTFNTLLDTSELVSAMYGVRGIPTTYIIGRDGNILSMLVGTREWNTPEIYQLFEDILAY